MSDPVAAGRSIIPVDSPHYGVFIAGILEAHASIHSFSRSLQSPNDSVCDRIEWLTSVGFGVFL